ncbi:MAG: GNAT family N-acetyltransferase [Bacteriovoracaceae bacterium]|nr:GNAT family N-acetyltransferase [Bacteriovoracaceae bacterium]
MLSFVQPLKGRYIILIPIRPEHKELLRPNAVFPEIWTHNTQISKYTPELYDTWFSLAYNHSLTGTHLPYMIEAQNGQLIGCSSYYSINKDKKEIAIGFTWITPAHWGTKVNPEMKYLMLEHAFNHGYQKVFFHVDNRNLHSQAAMKKLGATLNQIKPADKMRLDGSMRDTVEFVITLEEWPKVKKKLLARL